MIISKYSGNIIGYLDYYAEAGYRVNAVAGISRAQKVKINGYLSEKLAAKPPRLRNNLARPCVLSNAIRQMKICSRLFKTPAIYNSKGEYSPAFEAGNLLNITI